MSEQAIFSYMPVDAFLDKRLTLEQLRVLGALFSFRGKDSNTVWPSRQAIAGRCGMHPSTVRRASCSAAAVPPFCFIAAGRSIDESIRMAAKALGQTHATDVVVLAWKLRAAAEGRL